LRRSSGFTLIELLVVIVIVGVLTAIAVPTFLNQVKRSRAAEGDSGLATLSMATTIYSFDCGNYEPALVDLVAGVNCGDETGPWLESPWAAIAPNYSPPTIVAPVDPQRGSVIETSGLAGPYQNISCRKGTGNEAIQGDGCTIP
jgi:prepilin-type N-terminal cleavage/methylation domain-containing protein